MAVKTTVVWYIRSNAIVNSRHDITTIVAKELSDGTRFEIEGDIWKKGRQGQAGYSALYEMCRNNGTELRLAYNNKTNEFDARYRELFVIKK